MPKRVIKGKTYNTDSAQHLARARKLALRPDDARVKLTRDLYRTKAGAFFLVESVEIFRDERSDIGVVESVEFFPFSSEQAHAWARGDEVEVPGGNLGNMQVDVLVEGVFPPVPEATAEDVDKYYEDEEKDEAEE